MHHFLYHLTFFTPVFYRLATISGLVFLLCFYTTTSAQAQELVISGVITDANTGSPVPFANIGIENTTFGTGSNERGEYELHFSATEKNSVLSVSCIGYAAYKIRVNQIEQPKKAHISLTPRAYTLHEFTVRPQQLTGKQIVQRAIENIPTNYITKPSLMNGFYREYFEENGNFVGFAESALRIYDKEGYTRKTEKPQEMITSDEMRVSDIKNNSDYVLYIDIYYTLRANLLRNADFWLDFGKRTDHQVAKLDMEQIMVYGDDLVYAISYKAESKKRGIYEGMIYVRTSDFAVVRLEINAENTFKDRLINGSPTRSAATLIFKEHQNKFYLSYINANHDVAYQLKDKKYSLRFFSELFIQNIQTENIKPLPQDQALAEKSIFYQPRYRTYDPSFWENYRLFSDSPANAQIINDLEKFRDLDLQYRANGKLKVQKSLPN